MQAQIPPPPMIWMAVAGGQPFMRTGLTDDQADELIDELTAAVETFGVSYEAHLIDDLNGADSWTFIGHPLGIHHFPACALDDGAYS